MIITNASAEIMEDLHNPEVALGILKKIERIGRSCYVSEDGITDDSCNGFVQRLIQRGHEAMLEHASLSVKFTVDRGVSHEIVRHRIASFAQESTRYCNYSKGKFGGEITVIQPCFLRVGSPEWVKWYDGCKSAEDAYFSMLKAGCTPQEARDVLPTSLKTTLWMTASIREWRHFLKLRAAGTTGAPHPQMIVVALPLLKELQETLPDLFGDIEVKA